MRRSPLVRAALVWTAIAVAMACSRQDTLTPEAASAKGDELLKRMSQAVAATQAFSYTAEQSRERVRRNGEKVEEKFTRRVTVRRPNALAFADEGVGHDTKAWYDGKFVTLVSDSQKAWARGPMPATLDEAMDFVSAEYAIQIPTADLLYSSPYDALMTKDTKGGWVGEEKVGDTACDHLSYQQAVVDWEIWLTQDRTLPKKVRIKYKTQAGQPVTTVVFGNWNASPQVSDETFAAKIPDGYERLKIMRYATVEAKPAADAAPK